MVRPMAIAWSQVVEVVRHDGNQAVEVTHNLRKLSEMAVADDHCGLYVFISRSQETRQLTSRGGQPMG